MEEIKVPMTADQMLEAAAQKEAQATQTETKAEETLAAAAKIVEEIEQEQMQTLSGLLSRGSELVNQIALLLENLEILVDVVQTQTAEQQKQTEELTEATEAILKPEEEQAEEKPEILGTLTDQKKSKKNFLHDLII